MTAPWQFRNCGMGGRHTEKEYPESNISMQEAMFLILSARDYQDAQELTVRLQNRLKEIIEKEEGCRVMGIGLEGGLAPYIEKGEFPLPEVRLWSMMKQAIAECGCQPGVDVAIALDPAMSELENAYRAEFDMPDSVGMYLFWRDKAKVVLDRDAVLEIYVNAIEDFEIPLLSIEDGFSEDDYEGWRLLLERLGRQHLRHRRRSGHHQRPDDRDRRRPGIDQRRPDQGQPDRLAVRDSARHAGGAREGPGSGRVPPFQEPQRRHGGADRAGGQLARPQGRRRRQHRAARQIPGGHRADAQGGGGGGDTALHAGEKAVVRTLRAYEEPTNAGIPTVGVTLELGYSVIRGRVEVQGRDTPRDLRGHGRGHPSRRCNHRTGGASRDHRALPGLLRGGRDRRLLVLERDLRQRSAPPRTKG